MNSVCVVLALALSLGQDEDARGGRTAAQVVAIGRAQWLAAESERGGHSTQAMCQAESTFGECLEELNNGYLDRKPGHDRTAIAALRKDMSSFGGLATDVGFALTGGGTMWHPVYAGILADREEAIAALTGRVRREKGRSQSEVWLMIAAVSRAVDENSSDIEASSELSGTSVAGCRQKIAEMRSVFFRLVKLVANRASADRRAVFGFAYDSARVSRDV